MSEEVKVGAEHVQELLKRIEALTVANEFLIAQKNQLRQQLDLMNFEMFKANKASAAKSE